MQESSLCEMLMGENDVEVSVGWPSDGRTFNLEYNVGVLRWLFSRALSTVFLNGRSCNSYPPYPVVVESFLFTRSHCGCI
jgi:hypothetical protein